MRPRKIKTRVAPTPHHELASKCGFLTSLHAPEENLGESCSMASKRTNLHCKLAHKKKTEENGAASQASAQIPINETCAASKAYIEASTSLLVARVGSAEARLERVETRLGRVEEEEEEEEEEEGL